MDNTIANVKVLLGGATKVGTILSDVELTALLESNVYKSASKAAFAITAFYTHKASQTIDVLSIQNTARANAFRELAIEYDRIGKDYSDDSDTGKFVLVDTDDDNTNNEPIFKRDMFILADCWH